MGCATALSRVAPSSTRRRFEGRLLAVAVAMSPGGVRDARFVVGMVGVGGRTVV